MVFQWLATQYAKAKTKATAKKARAAEALSGQPTVAGSSARIGEATVRYLASPLTNDKASDQLEKLRKAGADLSRVHADPDSFAEGVGLGAAGLLSLAGGALWGLAPVTAETLKGAGKATVDVAKGVGSAFVGPVGPPAPTGPGVVERAIETVKDWFPDFKGQSGRASQLEESRRTGQWAGYDPTLVLHEARLTGNLDIARSRPEVFTDLRRMGGGIADEGTPGYLLTFGDAGWGGSAETAWNLHRTAKEVLSTLPAMPMSDGGRIGGSGLGEQTVLARSDAGRSSRPRPRSSRTRDSRRSRSRKAKPKRKAPKRKAKRKPVVYR